VILARHGSTEFNEAGLLLSSKDPSLTDRGKRQSEELASHLSNFQIGYCVASSARRSVETAEVVCGNLAIPWVTSNDLRERSLGSWEGFARQQVIDERTRLGLRTLDLTQDWEGCVDVEQDDEVFARTSRVITDARNDVSNSDILLITHAGVVKSFVYISLRIPQTRVFAFRITLGGFLAFSSRKDTFEINEVWPNPYAMAPPI
jgi:broad specificity phosphatase PhoE